MPWCCSKNDRIGGLLRYGIPDFKMEKHLIDRRVEQMEPRVEFRVISTSEPTSMPSAGRGFDAVALTMGSEDPRDLAVPDATWTASISRWISFPAESPSPATPTSGQTARGKHVVVIGGGDTGSDCGTSNRQGAPRSPSSAAPQPPGTRTSRWSGRTGR
jgi:glutamate synthase (NADPH/NADH) small chain